MLTLVLLPTIGQADDEAFLKQLAQRYEKLSSYCDKSIRSEYRFENNDSWRTKNFVPVAQYERCFSNNGWYKTTKYSLWHRLNIYSEWTLGKYWSRYTAYYGDTFDHVEKEGSNVYYEYPAKGIKKTSHHYREFKILGEKDLKIPIIYYALASGFFRHGGLGRLSYSTGNYDNIYSLKFLSEFKISKNLSNDEFTILEWVKIRGEKAGEITRYRELMWVSNHDMLIKRFQVFRDSKLESSMEIVDVQINPALSREDFSYEVPFFTKYIERYSLKNSPRGFLLFVFLTVFLTGFLFRLKKLFKDKRYIENRSLWEKSWVGRHLKFLAFAFIVPFSLYLFLFIYVINIDISYLLRALNPILILLCVIPLFFISSHAAYWVFERIISKRK